jgi:DNA-binding response OmpR family regulator
MAETSPLKNKKVFIVEDDLYFVNMISVRLKNYGCQISVAKDGEEAVKEIPKSSPDLLVLDLLLPGFINGFMVLEKIKSDPNLKNIPVVILSNLGTAEDVARGMRLGAFRYMVKAMVSLDEIIGNMENALKSNIS